MAPILSSVPLARVRFLRTTNNTAVSAATVTATPTVKSLTAAGQHGYIDLVPVVSQIDPGNPQVGYMDLVVTDDPDVAETFGWTISFDASDRATRVVSVPQSGAAVTTITVDGASMPSVWLDALAVFTGTSGATGSNYATTAYVTSAIQALQAAPDPFPSYALDSDVAAVRQVPSGATAGQALVATSPTGYGWGTVASGFTQSAVKTAAYTAVGSEIVRVNTSSGTFTVTGPASGAPFGVRWTAGTTAPTVAAPSGYTINGAATLTMGLAPSTSGELVTWQAFGTDYQPVGGFKPQTALDARYDNRYGVRGPTLDVFNPPTGSGLTAAVGDNTVDDAPAIQAALTYVKNTFGGGRVVVSKPNAAGIKCLSGITVPAKVQLASDSTVLFNFSVAPTGTVAFTVNDSDFTPLVGIRMDGGNFTPSSDPTNTSIGISATGVRLSFRDIALQYFGRGIDIAHSNTYILTFTDCGIGRCGTAFWADMEAVSAGNSGERIVLDRCTLANSNRAYQATGNGTHLRFTDCSIDFCTDIGKVNNGVVYHNGHIETNSSPHLFDVTGNAQMYFTDVRFVLAKCVLFKTGQGPANYGFGAARFDQCTAYFLDNTGAPTNRMSEDLVSWPANTTSITVYYPWPLKYCAITADFCFNDGAGVLNSDKVLVASMSSTTGALTLTAPTNTSQRWVRVKF